MPEITNQTIPVKHDTVEGGRCDRGECEKTANQQVESVVPVFVKINPTVGRIETECCGDPDVECRKGRERNACEIVISQKLNIKIPLVYKTVSCAGDGTIECKDC